MSSGTPATNCSCSASKQAETAYGIFARVFRKQATKLQGRHGSGLCNCADDRLQEGGQICTGTFPLARVKCLLHPQRNIQVLNILRCSMPTSADFNSICDFQWFLWGCGAARADVQISCTLRVYTEVDGLNFRTMGHLGLFLWGRGVEGCFSTRRSQAR